MARSFNGTSDFITPSHASTTLNLTGVMSLSFWMLSSQSATNSWVIAEGDGTGSHYAYTANLSSTNKMSFWNSGAGADITTAAVVYDNTWHHVVFTRAGSSGNWTLHSYVDGAPDNTASGVTNNPLSATTAMIGQADFTGRFFGGRLADVALWNVALTAGEALGLGKGIAQPYQIRTANLVAWWPFDGIQSPEPDLSGGASNGTLTGTALVAGPPISLLTPRWPQVITSAAASTTVFRKTLSSIGTRTGSRQAIQ